ncbi:hypothetical protein NUW58_g75 [Xylaria curta]|uniref:Uncharacterized protein n=2 Tax=Xylaria curta TaxID=42375 RepID=A0ACC1PLB2_9PEZI|nr:hypothetical protein NUW58_g1755 [Xylaria curta]KAJ2999195.1 hypothetical protein NUW58_g75 [Xylaria curta]
MCVKWLPLMDAPLDISAPWVQKSAPARKLRDDSVAQVQPALSGLPDVLPQNSQRLLREVLTAREFELTENYTANELLAKLQSRELSSEELTRAFLRRAALAHAATNCLTELQWDDAIERAKYLDSLPEPIGPLHGLPISTKEHQGTKGRNKTTNASYVAYDAGCVFFARTTQPQAIMHLETVSNIYGRTTNPYNNTLTPGGSSGGESALIGIRGSLLGLGGDIGGSIRVPAAHCGIYGLKPSDQRLPLSGAAGHMFGKETILATNGPMSTDRDSLSLFMKVVLDAQPWRLEPALKVAPWIPYRFTRPLKIAVQWTDCVVQPHPPMIRALREVSEACKASGHTIVEWNCGKLNHQKGWELLESLFYPDGGKYVRDLMKQAGEPILPLTKWIMEQVHVKDLTMHELWKACSEREAYRMMYAKAWSATADEDGQEVDVILCPPNFGAATPHKQSKYWGYSSIWNLLDYPGVVFPVTTVDPAKDPKDAMYKPRNAEDEFVYHLYDPATFKDAPVGLQVIGRRHCDEKVMAALELIENAMGRK